MKGLKKNAGFTLPEVAAVVAITGTLAAVVVPVAVDQIEKGRVARAAMDVDSIANAVSAFFRDTGEWPDRKGTAPDFYWVLRSGNANATFDLFATPTTGNVKDPGIGDTFWPVGPGRTDAMVNHLTLDNPGNLGASYRATNVDVNWNGPYMPQVFNDPWGRNYLIFVRAFTNPITGDDELAFVWVISGGPNKTLETDVSSPVLNNESWVDDDGGSGEPFGSTVDDDVGKMIYRVREAIPGVSSGG